MIPIRAAASTLIELLGMALVVFGVYLFDYRAAVIVGGLLLAVVGYAVAVPEPKRRAKQ